MIMQNQADNYMAGGPLLKMNNYLQGDMAYYQLKVGETLIELNQLLGSKLCFDFKEIITCKACGKSTKKSFNQGYCYRCFVKLAECDLCVMSPEKCHYHLSSCRDHRWGEQFCMTEHIVYLALTSDIKVGITRLSQLPTRWLDQGAIQALPVFRVVSRRRAGLIEAILKQYVKDKTNWRAMLLGQTHNVCLYQARDELLKQAKDEIEHLINDSGINGIRPIDGHIQSIHYPILKPIDSCKSISLDKTPKINGTLLGIKGQYLILDTGVFNIRKHTSYHVSFDII